MRKLIAVAAVLTLSSAYAAEELKFGDLNYFIKQGQVNVLADVNSSYEKHFTGDQEDQTRGIITNTSFGYAFTDRLNAYVGVNYAYDLETTDKTTVGNDDYSNDGFSNPSLGVNYRAFNQNEARYNFDIGAVARIGVEDAKRGDSVGNNVKDGNFADGRDSFELNARLGRKWNEANEWQAAVGAIYYHDGEYEQRGVTGDTKVDQDNSLDYFLRASYQYRPVNEFMVLLSAQANYIGEETDKVKSSNTKLKSDAHVDVDLRFTAKYLILENLIGKFNYGMSRNSDYDVADTEVRKRRENFFGLGIELLF